MKHLKLFENLNRQLEIGDYVLCIDGEKLHDSVFDRFLKENIGKYVGDLAGTKYMVVQFDYLPDNFGYMTHSKDMKNSLRFAPDEIIYWSKNKEELELIVTANKYNL